VYANGKHLPGMGADIEIDVLGVCIVKQRSCDVGSQRVGWVQKGGFILFNRAQRITGVQRHEVFGASASSEGKSTHISSKRTEKTAEYAEIVPGPVEVRQRLV